MSISPQTPLDYYYLRVDFFRTRDMRSASQSSIWSIARFMLTHLEV